MKVVASKKHTLNPEGWDQNHRQYMLRFAAKRVSDFATAEDLVQDTFLAAWNSRKGFRGECSERTWLMGVLRNKIIDLYRKNGRRPSVFISDMEPDFDEETAVFSWLDQQSDGRDLEQPRAMTERAEFLSELEGIVNSLPDKMGRAFQMREMQGCSTEEITRELKISPNNLWVLIHRARVIIADRLSSSWKTDREFGVLRAA